MDLTVEKSVVTIKAGQVEERADTLIQQITYSLEINGIPEFSSVCCPGDLLPLAYGYLLTQGYMPVSGKPPSALQNGNVVQITMQNSNRMKEVKPVQSAYTLTPEAVLSRVVEFVKAGVVFKETGATHSAAIGTETDFGCYVEDISRSAALEKVIGEAYMNNILFNNSFITLSSRVPEGFVKRIARVGIPVIAAISAPTVQAVLAAEKLGICLCGFVRGNRMNVYSGKWRLGL